MMRAASPLAGAMLIAITALATLREWGAAGPLELVLPVLTLAVLVILTAQVRPTRKIFAAVGIALTLALMLTRADWPQIALAGLAKAAFIAAFFTALATLRFAAESSASIRKAGTFLAQQPPGRRYAALTVGGQMFAMLLNYGAIALLGSLAAANAAEEPDPEIRRHRTRRMLLAIQRGFISTLPWSPLSFAMAISTALIPGASWTLAVVPGLVTAAILAGTGWALDTIFKPRLTVRPKRVKPEGSWALLLPLALLLAILVTSVIGLRLLTGVRVVGLVIAVVPAMALAWVWLQHNEDAAAPTLAERARRYTFTELPGYRDELMLLMMAGYIGTTGAPLLGPLIASAGLDTGALPAALVLASFVWLIPLFGQLGMNPILAVTLMAPLIPGPAELGVTPTAVVAAIGAGWALSGASSPFTATTLLIGSFGKVSALHVGLRWNGAYTLLCAVLLTGWVLLYAFVLS